MASATNYLRTKIGAHTLKNTPYTSPSVVYVALFTTAVNVSGGGTEVTGGSYARGAISFTETDPGRFENGSMSIANMPETTVVGLGIMDAATGGNMLYFINFSAVSVAASATYPINANTLTIRHL
jgi:hypothetical protein